MEETATGRAEARGTEGGDRAASARRRRGLIAGAAVFAVLLLVPPPAELGAAGWRAAAVGLLMAVWWMTEAIPIPATALLPLLLFPLLGVTPIADAAAPYANPLIFLFLGGFLIALAMERWRLHRRIALAIVARVGTRPRRIVAGFMVASAFLSMWISNTATAMMMMPIGLSIVGLVAAGDRHRDGGEGGFAICLMLGIAYASSLGGLATLVGTPTNALLAGFLLESYGFELAFVDWMLIGLPLTAVGLGVSFYLLTRWIYPIRIRELPGGRRLIEEERRRLGPLGPGEARVAAVFALTALGWIFRPLVEDWLPGLTDTGVALLGALLLFVLPVDWRHGVFTLDWHEARRLPWGVLLLFGGGLSLASAIRDTGLAGWIGARMAGLEAWPVVPTTLLVVVVIVFLTEMTSNTATAAAFLPVLASIAVGIGQPPLLLLVPATLAASCAFMLPVATPPNAIVYGSGRVTIPQMAHAGIWLNLVFVVLVTLFTYALLPLVLGVEPGVVPAWAGGR